MDNIYSQRSVRQLAPNLTEHLFLNTYPALAVQLQFTHMTDSNCCSHRLAMAGDDRQFWFTAIKKGIESFKRHKTYETVPMDKHMCLTGSKLV